MTALTTAPASTIAPATQRAVWSPEVKDSRTAVWMAATSRPGTDGMSADSRPCCAIAATWSTTNEGRPSAASAPRNWETNWLVTMEPRTAMPNTPPTCRAVFRVPDAMPARAAGTVLIMAVVTGLMTRPIPIPMMVSIHQYVSYGVVAWTAVNPRSAPPIRVIPTVMGSLAPMRPTMRPERMADTMTARVAGSWRTPAPVAE